MITITFNSCAYTLDSISVQSGPELVQLYNDIAKVHGQSTVKRFADIKSAARRTWVMLEQYGTLVASEVDDLLDGEEMAHYEAKATPAGESIPEDSTPNPQQQLAEALLEREEARVAALPPKVDGRCKSKHVEPTARCYRPRAGTKQAVMYDLIAGDTGCCIQEFCDHMNAGSPDNKMPWVPSNVWGALRYLFVTQKGYGLNYSVATGRIRLLIGKTELTSAKSEA